MRRAKGLALARHARSLALALALSLVLTLGALGLAALSAMDARPVAGHDPGVRGETVIPLEDTIGDGLADVDEIFRYGTNPQRIDTAGDGIPDGWKVAWQGCDAAGFCRPDPLRADAGDRLSGPEGMTSLEKYEWTRQNLVEPAEAACQCKLRGEALMDLFRRGLDPWKLSTVDDGIPDTYKIRYGLDPLDPELAEKDPVGKGMTIREQARHGLDPFRLDTSNNGLSDYEAIHVYRTDPTKFSTVNDGIPDGWKVRYGLDPLDPLLAWADPSGTGATILEEYRFNLPQGWTERDGVWWNGTNPMLADTGGDGLGDDFAARFGVQPRQLACPPPAAPQARCPNSRYDPTQHHPGADPTGTGLTLRIAYEQKLGPFRQSVDPFRSDADGDEILTIEEVQGYDIVVNGRSARVFSNPNVFDTAGDGLGDKRKRELGLSPITSDTDGDGLPDRLEIDLGTDALKEDSAGDGLLDGERYEYLRVRHAQEIARLEGGNRTFVDRLRALDDAYASLDDRGLLDLLGPNATLRPSATDRKNMLEPDWDGDGLVNGQEVKPDTGLIPIPPTTCPDAQGRTGPRSPIDPMLSDTSGDGLRDGWKVANACWVPSLGGWDLDASKYDSDGSGVSDGEKNFMNDGIHFYDPNRGALQYVPFHNLRNQQYGTNPHLLDSSGDGLSDGYEALWTERKPEGAPDGWRLDPTKADTFVGDPLYCPTADPCRDGDRDFLEGIEPVRIHNRTATTAGNVVCDLVSLNVTQRHAARVSPFHPQTLADGVPDAYKIAYALDPLDADLVRARLDGDAHGLTLLQKWQVSQLGLGPPGCGAHPLESDTDGGGIPDALELSLGLNPLDPGDDDPTGDPTNSGLTTRAKIALGLDPFTRDSSGNGLIDGGFGRFGFTDEMILDIVDGRDVVIPNPNTRRCPQADPVLCPAGSYNDLDIKDPSQWDSAGDGLPDDWKIAYGLTPVGERYAHLRAPDGLTYLQKYRWGMPADWNLQPDGTFDYRKDGTWWGGLHPQDARTDGRTFDPDQRDLDHDGLDDFNGEDPFPVDDQDNDGTWDTTAPWDSGGPWCSNDAVVSRGGNPSDLWTRGIRYGNCLDRYPKRLSLHTDADRNGIPDWQDRVAMSVTATAPEGNLVSKASPFVVSARVTCAATNDRARRECAAVGAPVAGVPVLVSLDDRALAAGPDAYAPDGRGLTNLLGAGFTDADGRVQIVASFGRNSVVVPAGLTLAGRTGELAWTYARTIPAGPGHHLLVWVPNTTAAPGGPPPLSGATASFAVQVHSTSHFLLDSSPTVENERPLVVAARLVDSTQSPLANRNVTLAWMGTTVVRTTDGAGAFNATLPTPDREPGAYPLVLSFASSEALLVSNQTAQPIRVQYPTRFSGLQVVPALPATGERITASAALLDYRGEPLPGRTVVLLLAGAEVANATTDDNGTFALSYVLPRTVAAGLHNLTVRFAGEPAAEDARLYREVAAYPGLSVRRATAMSLRDFHVFRGAGAAVVNGTLLDENGEPFACNVAIVLGGLHRATAECDARGQFRATIPHSALARQVGAVPLVAEFVGTPFHRESRAVSTMFIQGLPHVALSVGDAQRQRPYFLNGTVLDDAGQPIRGQAVVATFAGAPLPPAPTDADGRFSIRFLVPRETLLGTAVVTARLSPTPAYADGEIATASVRVLAATVLTLPERGLFRGDAVLAGRLLDDLGRPVTGARVSLFLENRTHEVATALDGGFSLSVNLPSSRAAGPLSALARFGGFGDYASTQVASTYSVLGRASFADFVVGNLAAGRENPVSGRLAQENGAPVPAGQVRIRVDGADMVALPVAASGTFAGALALPASFPAGSHLLEATYEGAFMTEARLARSVRVLVPVELSAVVESESLAPGQAFRTQILLREAASGAPVQGRVGVGLAYRNATVNLTVFTDAQGRASFSTVFQEGLTLTMRYGGDDARAPETTVVALQRTHALVPGGLTGLVALLGALAAVLLGVAYLVARRERARVEEARAIVEWLEGRLRAGDEAAAVVIAAHARLVEHFARHGVLAKEAATAREVAQAATESLAIHPDRMSGFTELFERARYSGRPIEDPDKARALRLLRGILDDLDFALGRRLGTSARGTP